MWLFGAVQKESKDKHKEYHQHPVGSSLGEQSLGLRGLPNVLTYLLVTRGRYYLSLFGG